MTARGKPNAIEGCPLTAAMAAVGGKWKLVIVYWLSQSPLHFAALQRRVDGISQKVLTQQLRELVADGIVKRQETGPIPSPVIYSLTEYGYSLKPMLAQLLIWGKEHLGRLSVSLASV
ncbi:MAG: helix-turn-helix transcriptional regulator [Reyranella sp.]|nr:helix-turn-helix transcriptional regulator [Reyranella sp.]MBL6651757.1 helix-turn-helix transcriptional regulator [Reyranella sp.]